MPVADQNSFLASLRLGWAMAETRGRYRIGDDPDRLGRPAGATAVVRAENALPLAGERSPAEERIEVASVLTSLAGDRSLDPLCSELSGQPPAVATMRASDRLTMLAKAMTGSDDPKSASRRWHELTEFLFAWDAYIQDTAAGRTFRTASAYQLGRALAEIFWALDPDAPADSPQAWEFLLGDERRKAIKTLLSRLSDQFAPLTADAVSWSLDHWGAVARDRKWRGGGSAPQTQATIRCLAIQNLLWRDLLLTGRDPRDLVAPADFLRRARSLRPVIRSFLPEVALLAGGVAVLTGAAALLTSSGGGDTAAAALAVVGVTGISGAGLAAKAKEAAHQVLERLQVQLDRDAVRAAVVILPNRP